MFEVLYKYLADKFKITEDEFDFIKSKFTTRIVAKGEIIQSAGQIPRKAIFVEKGCLRMYMIDAKIKERIINFAPETWWLSDTINMLNNTPSEYIIDAIEDSEILLLSPSAHKEILENIPGYASSFQSGIQKHAAAKDKRIASSLNATAEEKYQYFLETYPTLLLRIPQHMLASYLGITPETLSRIRKKMSLKKRT